jgi:hypothetical protein
LIESNYAAGDYQKARAILHQLKGRIHVGAEYYVDSAVYAALDGDEDTHDTDSISESLQ